MCVIYIYICVIYKETENFCVEYEDIEIDEKRKSSFSLLLRYAFHRKHCDSRETKFTVPLGTSH